MKKTKTNDIPYLCKEKINLCDEQKISPFFTIVSWKLIFPILTSILLFNLLNITIMDETNFAPPNDDNLLYFSEQRAIHGIGFIFQHRAYIYRAWKAEAKLGIAMIFNVACIFCTDFSIDSDCFRC